MKLDTLMSNPVISLFPNKWQVSFLDTPWRPVPMSK